MKARVIGWCIWNGTMIELIDDGHGQKLLRIKGQYIPLIEFNNK